ncbi:ribose transport system substrate-binding protein [Rhizobiales bacterium GAS191]|jgi:ribose transport system substrate-binding protein|nr:ribose transport system substrate-binding protein [Rhizobiales bacterium GAS188]SED35377.1 ribose transport system substrate-binding protein [Rhizobiales bacterium GAS191]
MRFLDRNIGFAVVGASALTMLGYASARADEFYNQKDYDAQVQLLQTKAEGPEGKPWEQRLGGQMADTSKYKKKGPYRLCFSNADVGNPWRVVGWNTMQAEVDLNKADIASFSVADAQGKDDKQISDIKSFVSGGNCDILIVSPNTTAALTPAVEDACKSLPVIVFDRGVRTTCPVSFVHPIGGYAFGKVSADFIVSQIPKGGSVLALRILPGVDVLETRWAAAKRVFEEKGVKVVGVEFTGGDRAKTKSIVDDYLARFGKIDGVWMDAGATSVAAIEAYEDAGKPAPAINGEDQQDFLQKWKADNLKAIAPTYAVYVWRSAIIAALKVMKGEPVPAPEWNLPQPTITAENLAKYVNAKMPPLHYAMCGCEDMPNYPARWGGK